MELPKYPSRCICGAIDLINIVHDTSCASCSGVDVDLVSDTHVPAQPLKHQLHTKGKITPLFIERLKIGPGMPIPLHELKYSEQAAASAEKVFGKKPKFVK